MTGISIKVDLEKDEARLGLRALLDRMDDRRPFFAAVGERMVGSSKDHFRNENAPDGTVWKPLRPATIKARQQKKQLPLTILRSNSKDKSGSSLAGSISYDATAEQVSIGSAVETAAIHQLGGTINKPARAAKIYRKLERDGSIGRRFVKKRLKQKVETDVTIPAHKIIIPARPYLGLTAADEAGIREDAEGWLIR